MPQFSKRAILLKDLEAIAKSCTIEAYLRFCFDEDRFESTWDQPKLWQLSRDMATTQGAKIASWAFLRTLPGPVKQLWFMESRLWSHKRSMEIGGVCKFLLER